MSASVREGPYDGKMPFVRAIYRFVTSVFSAIKWDSLSARLFVRANITIPEVSLSSLCTPIHTNKKVSGGE